MMSLRSEQIGTALNEGLFHTSILNFLFFWLLSAILGAALATIFDTCGVECAANDVVANAWEVFNTTAANHDYGVLLQVVTNARDVCGNFKARSQANPSDFSQR